MSKSKGLRDIFKKSTKSKHKSGFDSMSIKVIGNNHQMTKMLQIQIILILIMLIDILEGGLRNLTHSCLKRKDTLKAQQITHRMVKLLKELKNLYRIKHASRFLLKNTFHHRANYRLEGIILEIYSQRKKSIFLTFIQT
jgi:hypothetical protein